MPASMRQEEGRWGAVVCDNGRPVTTLLFTVMYEISQYETCMGVQASPPHDPIGITHYFVTTDGQVYMLMRFHNYAMNYNPDVKFVWQGPTTFTAEREKTLADPDFYLIFHDRQLPVHKPY